MSELSIAQAAEVLGLNESRVRALAARGDLRARKIGSRWLVDDASVRARRERGASEGRPFSPRVAWAYLLLLSGEPVAWLDAASRSRLRARLRHDPVARVLPRLRRRAEVRHYRAAASALALIESAADLVRSGVSAAGDYGASIRASGQLDGYLTSSRMRKIAYQAALEPVDPREANVVLRVSALPFVLRGRKIAPAGAVAADLLESVDQRTSRAGNELAERLRADRSKHR